ncbi:MAG TPA: IS110 family transposase [Chromatiaceae bacterium]|nr:IS110 family transposase [Chromatiaceae bacterium]
MAEYTIGVDVSKAFLDVHRLPDGKSTRFSNDKKGHKALARWLKGPAVVRVVYEPTGAYHRGFERRLAALGLPLVKVNPLQARRFAQAKGQRAKTDPVDARMLAEMGLCFGLQADAVTPEIIRRIKELQIARMALIKGRTRTKNRAYQLTLPLLKAQNAARLKQIKSQLTALETEIQRLIASDPELLRKSLILCSIKGISQVTAAALIAEMPELGTLAPKQAASLAGLAPVARDSGQWRGKRFIQGGRKFLREALYMPALVAIRFNPDMKMKYQALKAAGKPSKVALTAIMRKLIILANTLIQKNRIWVENLS